MIEGSNRVLNFTIEADPFNSNNISRADGRPVPDRTIITPNSIIFREVVQNDTGQYIISTTNLAGTAMSTITLNVTAKTITGKYMHLSS